MVRRRNRLSRRRQTQKKRKKSSRGRRKGRTLRNTQVGGLIVSGIRPVLSLIPGIGGTLRAMADIYLKSVSLSSSFTTSEGVVTLAESQVYSLQCQFPISLINIVSRSPIIPSQLKKVESIRKVCVVSTTHLKEGRLISLTIRYSPSNPMTTTSGRVAMVFIPYRSFSDKEDYAKEWSATNESNVVQTPGAISGSARSVLTTSFAPKPSDSYSYMYHTLGDVIGVVRFIFTDLQRSDYKDFKPDDFQPNITISGTVELRQPQESGDIVTFNDTMMTNDSITHLSYVDGRVIAVKNGSFQGNNIVGLFSTEGTTRSVDNVSDSVQFERMSL